MADGRDVTELVIDADTSGADRFSTAMDRAAGSAREGMNSVQGMTMAIAGVSVAFIGALAGLQGFVAYVGSVNQKLIDIAEASRTASMSTREFQEALFAARAAGLGEKDFFSGIDRIGADLTAASRGVTEFGKLFEANGLSIRATNGELKSTKAALADIAGLMQNATPQVQQGIARIVGLSKDWVPFLRQGTEAIEQQKAAAGALGVIIDDEVIQRARVFDREWKTAVATWDLQFKASLNSILPLLVQLAGYAATVIDAIGSVSTSVSRWLTPDDQKTGTQLTAQIAEAEQLREKMTRVRGVMTEIDQGFLDFKLRRSKSALGLPEDADVKALDDYIAKLKQMRDAKAEPSRVIISGGSSVLPATGSDTDAVDRAIQSLDKHIERQKADTAAVGLGEGALARFRAEAAMTAAVQANGGKITDEQAAAFARLIPLAGATVDALARARVASQIDFDRQTAFLSPQDLQIAQQLRGIYGNDVPRALQSAEAEAMRFNQSLRGINDTVRDASQSFTKDLVSGLSSGKSMMDALGSAASNLSAKLTDKAITSLFSGDFMGAAVSGIGALISGIFGNNAKKREQEERDAKAAAERMIQYSQRATLAGLDTTTRAGSLAAQEAQFQAERLQEAQNGNRALESMLNAQNAERLALQQDWDRKEIEAAKAKQDAIDARTLSAQDRLFTAMNDNTTLEGQLAAADRQFLRERLEEMKAGGQALNDLVAAQEAERVDIVKKYNDELVKFVQNVAKTIRQYLESLKTGSSSILSPQEQLAAAQSNFQAQLVKAQGGDRDALSGITQVAQTYLDQARSFYASSAGYTDIYKQVVAALEGVANVSAGTVSDADRIVAAVNDNRTATTGTITTTSLQEQSLLGAMNMVLGAINGLNDRLVAALNQLGAITSSVGSDHSSWLAGIYAATSKSAANSGGTFWSWLGFRHGGRIPGYADGGMVGNGIYDVDSVIARYAGGGDIALAGGEFVNRAGSVNASTLPMLQYINDNGRLPGQRRDLGGLTNDNAEILREIGRLMASGNAAIVARLERVEAAFGDGTARIAEAQRRASEKKRMPGAKS